MIIDNYIKKLYEKPDNNIYFILVLNLDYYLKFECRHIKIITINPLYSKNIFMFLLYYFKFPSLIKKYSIDLVFNFGDIIIPTKIKQIYFFDWAYAVDTRKIIWKMMPVKEQFFRRIKKYLIIKLINDRLIVICQTECMKSALIKQTNISYSQIHVLPTPLSIDFPSTNNTFSAIKDEKLILFYPASFAPHKNYNLIYEFGQLIDLNNLPIEIILTLNKSESKSFWKKVKSKNLNSIKTVGKLEYKDIIIEYKKCHALFFPSLLESYGIPLIEAMAIGKPIFVSNLPYAKVLCNDAAYYFDPYDSKSALNCVTQIFNEDEVVVNNKIKNGFQNVLNIGSWDIFLSSVSEIINKNII